MYKFKNKQVSILVVEDNLLDALIVKTLLQAHFNIEHVVNGIDALNIIDEINFDIILMDINLGDDDLDGFKLMTLIKDNPKHQHIKIVALTAYSENTELFMNHGFDELFVKPVIKEEIFEFINKTMMDKEITIL